MNTEKPVEGNEVIIVDLLDMPPLEVDKGKIVDLSGMSLLGSDEEEVKEGKKTRNLDSKQTINQNFSIISANKSWK